MNAPITRNELKRDLLALHRDVFTDSVFSDIQLFMPVRGEPKIKCSGSQRVERLNLKDESGIAALILFTRAQAAHTADDMGH